jgi:hypothetical protein
VPETTASRPDLQDSLVPGAADRRGPADNGRKVRDSCNARGRLLPGPAPPGNGRPQPSWKIELTEETQKGLADRLDGVALLAEALAHEHPTGRFHEYLRLFERAFARPARNLAEPLAEVLDPRFGYTTGEIEHWLGVLRDPATHADARPVFVLEADVRPVVGRIHQAVFDLLMNKENWRSADTARRELWRAPTGTTGMGNDSFATRGEALAITAQLMDPFDAYPMDLGDHEPAAGGLVGADAALRAGSR